ncbi:MAG: NAD+ synthase [Gammaproteobacteria bacterium]|nr:NAD+ synthase [Gammaproteobacteria bacterium]
MTSKIRLCLAQSNYTVGALEENRDKIITSLREAAVNDSDIVIYPELALTGYPPEDLLLRPAFIEMTSACLQEICAACTEVIAMVGYPLLEGKKLYNACAVIRDGNIITNIKKQILPNYGVFDEKRYFSGGTETTVLDFLDVRMAITICEDIWEDEPAIKARDQGAELLININASPFHMNKLAQRHEVVSSRARQNGLDIVYVNCVGGQDELVFDGGSLAFDRTGNKAYQADEFREQLYYIDYFKGREDRFTPLQDSAPPMSRLDNIYSALVLGIRDYVHKNHFNGAVIGLSGGIDSALTLCLAVAALGKENVETVLMPSPFTAPMSIEDAVQQSGRLGVKHTTIPIEKLYEEFNRLLEPVFAGREPDVTEENIQARIRGTLLMAISNKTGLLVLATGNKSEMSVGYSTLYGDMVGGFAPLKDLSKTLVYELAGWINRDGEIIPDRVLQRPPSAELRPDQRDEDSLPPYSVLDPILERYIERDQTPQKIIEAGFDHDTVLSVVRMVDRNEYKRRQAAPGVRISQRAFGRDRRYPITSGYRES